MSYVLMLPTSWMLVIIILLAIGTIAIGVIRNRRFKRKQDAYHTFADKNGLRVAFRNPHNFTIFGEYRGLSIRVEPHRGLIANPSSRKGVIFNLPLVNPNIKAIRIVKIGDKHPWINDLYPIDNPIFANKNLGDKVVIQSNDMLFSSFLLSDDVIIDLGILFNRIEAGIIFIYQDELGCVMPHFLFEPDMQATWQLVLDLLCDIKEELMMK